MQGPSLYDTRVRKLVEHFDSMDNETEMQKKKSSSMVKKNKSIYDNEGKVRRLWLSDIVKKQVLTRTDIEKIVQIPTLSLEQDDCIVPVVDETLSSGGSSSVSETEDLIQAVDPVEKPVFWNMPLLLFPLRRFVTNFLDRHNLDIKKRGQRIQMRDKYTMGVGILLMLTVTIYVVKKLYNL